MCWRSPAMNRRRRSIASISSPAATAGPPFRPNTSMATMRGIFHRADDAGHVKTDPSANVQEQQDEEDGRIPDLDRGGGRSLRAPLADRSKERVWIGVLLYTGFRRGDAVRIGRQHVRNGVATLRTEKNDTAVTIPILPVLAEILRAGPCADLAFICGERHKPLKKESFRELVPRGLPRRWSERQVCTWPPEGGRRQGCEQRRHRGRIGIHLRMVGRPRQKTK
jgi:integrase